MTQQFVEALAAFDPATVYEAAGKRGMVDPAIRPAWSGARLCGRAITVQCPPGDNLGLHHAVIVAEPGDVLVATVSGFLMAGAWGEVLTEAALARGIAGLCIDGCVRDIAAIEALRFPIFSRGLAIGSCTKTQPAAINCPITFGGVLVRPGDFILGDPDGLVVVEQEAVEMVCASARARHETERRIIAGLRSGKTTVELLGLPQPRGGR